MSNTTSKPPISTYQFIGRKTEIDLLVQSLSGKSSADQTLGAVTIISGETGRGKTALALNVAEHLGQEYPDGQIFLSFNGDPTDELIVLETLGTIIHSIDPFARLSDDLHELHELYTSLLESKKVLIIIDQVSEVADLFYLLPPKMSAMLFTSRYTIELPEAFNLELQNLNLSDAHELISAVFPKAKPYASLLAQLCCYNPLAIKLSAGVIINDKSFTAKELVETLKNFVAQENSNSSNILSLLRFLTTRIYQQLDEQTQNIFLQLGVFSGLFSKSTVSNLLDGLVVIDKIPQQLETLSRVNLLSSNESEDPFEMHNFTRSFALKHLKNPYDVHLRMANYYADIIEEISTISLRGSDGIQLGLLFFDEYKVHIKKSWKWLLRQDITSPIINVLVLRYYQATETFGRLRFFPKNELIPQAKRALEAAEQLNEKDKIILISNNLADINNTFTGS